MMRAKKHLGQHFLNSPRTIEAMLHAAQLSKDDTVFEIGPGKGVLTETLLQTAGRVIALEKDAELLPHLAERFEDSLSNDSLQLIEGDVRDTELLAKTIAREKNYKVIANIPYYLTGQFFRTFLEMEQQPASITVLIQKEVAERIVARNGKQSLLSIAISAFGTATYVCTVAARYFSPPPKIDSAVIHINNINHDHFKNPTAQEHFFEVLHVGFAHKRKTLAHNLRLKYPREVVDAALLKLNTPPQIRAEECEIDFWLQLADSLEL